MPNTNNFTSHFQSYFPSAFEPSQYKSKSGTLLSLFFAIQFIALGIYAQFFLTEHFVTKEFTSFPLFIIGIYNVISFICTICSLPLANFNYFFIYLPDVFLTSCLYWLIYLHIYNEDKYEEVRPKMIKEFGSHIDLWLYIIITFESKIIFYFQQLVFYNFKIGFFLWKSIAYLFVSICGIAVLSAAAVLIVKSNHNLDWFPTELHSPFQQIGLITKGVTGVLMLLSMVNDSKSLTKWLNFFIGLALIGNLALSVLYIFDIYVPAIPEILIKHMFDPRDAKSLGTLQIIISILNLIIFISSILGYPQPPKVKHIIRIPNQNPPLYSSAV